MTLCKMALSIVTLSTTDLMAILSINDTTKNDTHDETKYRVPLFLMSVEFAVRLSVIVQSVMAPFMMILSINVNFYDGNYKKVLRKT
jgi:hypothetical protein